jgi:hypothetical protein
MPIRVKILFGEHRFSEVVAKLKRVDTPGTLAKINLQPFEKKALLFLQRIFPVSKKGSTNQKEFGMHLVEGWRVNRILLATTLGFQIDHVLRGNRHASKILDALDIGTNAWNYVASRTLHFIDRRGRGRTGKPNWVSVRAGDSIHHQAHGGTFYRQRTFNYINEILLPQIRDKVSEVVAKEVNG